MSLTPTADELQAAPLLEGWFYAHPEIADGDHRHTSPVVDMDRDSPLGTTPGGSDDIVAMLDFIKQTKPFSDSRLARMEKAYREERERGPSVSWNS